MDTRTPKMDESFRSKFRNTGSILQLIAEEQEQLTQDITWEPLEKHLQNSVRQVNVQKRSSKASSGQWLSKVSFYLKGNFVNVVNDTQV